MSAYDFPECTTFGALIRFGLELERAAADVYRELAGADRLEAARAVFGRLQAAHERRRGLLEVTRREKLNEMILEPIQEMRRERYVISAAVPENVDLATALQLAAAIERTSAAFYSDAASTCRSLLAEAARVMTRLGEENSSNVAALGAVAQPVAG